MIPRILIAALFGVVIVFVSLLMVKIYGSGLHLSQTVRRNLFLPAVLVPLLFFISALTVTSALSSAGTVFYDAMNVIAGMFFYLCIGAGLLGILLLFAAAAKSTLPVWIAYLILLLSISLGIVGLIQATYIKVTEYTVALPGAPTSWEGKTAALISDTHFGIVNRGVFSDKAINKIISLHPDFVLHSGDFYDGPRMDTAPITASWKRLTDSIPVFYAPGNHESYGNFPVFISSIAAAHVTVLTDKQTSYDGVTILGLNYRERGREKETAVVLSDLHPDPSIPAILINHAPTFMKEAEAAGVDLLVSGHTHNGQFWPINYLVRMLYGKYSYGLESYGSMSTITTSGIGTYGPPFRLFNTPEIVLVHFTVK